MDGRGCTRVSVWLMVSVLLPAGAAGAEWKATNDQVTAAAKQADIAKVLEAVNIIDHALIVDDRASFVSFLAQDLVVNNPQNGISLAGATDRRNASGLISYSRYVRSVEYAGELGDMVLLMGDERVMPKETPLWPERKYAAVLPMCGSS